MINKNKNGLRLLVADTNKDIIKMVGYEFRDYERFKNLHIGKTYIFRNLVSQTVKNALGSSNMRSKFLKLIATTRVRESTQKINLASEDLVFQTEETFDQLSEKDSVNVKGTLIVSTKFIFSFYNQ